MGDAKRTRAGDPHAAGRPTTARERGAASADRGAVHDVAPHVHAVIDRICSGDVSASSELLSALGSEQRRGWRALPDPLPVVAALEAHARSALPEGAERQSVLVLAVCETGPVQVLGTIAGCEPERVSESPFGDLVQLRGGRFRFLDAALRAHVLAAATSEERLRAHQLLAQILGSAGDDDAALWHRARGAVLGDPGLVEPLLVLACAALREGDAERAWSFATEAAEHARPGTPAHAGAQLLGGRAALAGGQVEDALERFEQALRIDGGHRNEAAAAFVLAHVLRHGTTPAQDPRVSADAIGRGCGLAARLSAPFGAMRGARERGTAWLAAGGFGQGDDIRATLPSGCGAPAGGATAPAIDGVDVGRVTRALRIGLGGDPDAGLRALAEPGASEEGAAPLLDRHERAPLLRARRAVADVLLHVWAGRIGAAHQLLGASAAQLPVALPFGGVAAALCRRLELAVDGRIGPLSHELAAAAPWTHESDGFVDRAIDAYLRGCSDEASVHMALWTDRGRLSGPLALPGLDEVGPLGASSSAEPPEATLARTLRERVRSARESSWQADLDAVAAESRGIRSPFERARVEALLGSTAASRGDRGRGVRHLRAALSLFEESGSPAWRGMVSRRLRVLESRRRPSSADAGAQEEDAASGSGSLGICRAMWEPILTARELEVALLMAEGRTNREIAAALHVSVRTVEVHGGRIFAKVDVRTRHELTVLAHRTDQHL